MGGSLDVFACTYARRDGAARLDWLQQRRRRRRDVPGTRRRICRRFRRRNGRLRFRRPREHRWTIERRFGCRWPIGEWLGQFCGRQRRGQSVHGRNRHGGCRWSFRGRKRRRKRRQPIVRPVRFVLHPRDRVFVLQRTLRRRFLLLEPRRRLLRPERLLRGHLYIGHVSVRRKQRTLQRTVREHPFRRCELRRVRRDLWPDPDLLRRPMHVRSERLHSDRVRQRLRLHRHRRKPLRHVRQAVPRRRALRGGRVPVPLGTNQMRRRVHGDEQQQRQLRRLRHHVRREPTVSRRAVRVCRRANSVQRRVPESPDGPHELRYLRPPVPGAKAVHRRPVSVVAKRLRIRT
jgi:hypothetical protein